MIGGTFERNVGGKETAEGVRQFGAGRIKYGQMIQAGSSGRWRGTTGAFPGVEADVVMVAASGKKSGLAAEALGEFKTQNIAIKSERAVKVRDLEMDMADADLRMKLTGVQVGLRVEC
jgi:hypothetical protein